jgi:hypothetical protein
MGSSQTYTHWQMSQPAVGDEGHTRLLLLLLLLQEDEVPSDFQDYSLVTLVGVAAHLMHVRLTARSGTTGICTLQSTGVVCLDRRAVAIYLVILRHAKHDQQGLTVCSKAHKHIN